MRKMIFLCLALLLCLPLASYAGSIGGAKTQGQGKFSISLDQEFVFKRDLEFDKMMGGLEPGEEVKDAEVKKMYRTMLKTSYGVLENLDVFVKLGVADWDGEAKWYEDGVYDGKEIHKGKNALAYGIGLKATYPLENDWLIGADLQYLRHKNNYSAKDIDADPTHPDETGKGKMTAQEWHIAPYIAKKIGNFTPYLGAKYSDLRIKAKEKEWEGESSDWWIKFKAKRNVGLFLGTDYKIADNWKFNLEGRFVDETAMSLAATYKF